MPSHQRSAAASLSVRQWVECSALLPALSESDPADRLRPADPIALTLAGRYFLSAPILPAAGSDPCPLWFQVFGSPCSKTYRAPASGRRCSLSVFHPARDSVLHPVSFWTD